MMVNHVESLQLLGDSQQLALVATLLVSDTHARVRVAGDAH